MAIAALFALGQVSAARAAVDGYAKLRHASAPELEQKLRDDLLSSEGAIPLHAGAAW